MRKLVVTFAIFLSSVAIASAQTPPLKPELAGVSFLVGTWTGGDGKVADTGETSTGSSSITAEVSGSVLLRRDHTNLFGPGGKPTGQFDQIMMIYPEGTTLHADYSDGTHIIHYTSATIDPGHSVAFTSAIAPGASTFRLTYEDPTPDTLTVRFEIAPPGQTAFHPIAVGTLHRAP